MCVCTQEVLWKMYYLVSSVHFAVVNHLQLLYSAFMFAEGVKMPTPISHSTIG